MSTYLTAAEIAPMFGVIPETVLSWIRDGKLPSITVGKRLKMVPRRAVERFTKPSESRPGGRPRGPRK